MTLYKWSQTASADATADSTINWAEGQSPSSVNDSARAMMAAIAKYRDDVAGAIVTTGSSTAYAVNTYQVFQSLSQLNGQVIAFTPHATNGVAATLNVDNLGSKPIRSTPSLGLSAGVLVEGTPYLVLYNNLDQAFYLRNSYGNPYAIPIGGLMPFTGMTAPNSAFVLPYGQAISRTTYSTYFAMVGSTYGVGDGSTTFNVPDLRGRVIAGIDTMGGTAASRLTDAGSGFGDTLGETGGTQNVTLTTAQIPNHNHTLTDPGHTHSFNNNPVVTGQNTAQTTTGNSFTMPNSPQTSAITSSTTGISIAATGGGGAHTNVQPTIVLNYLLRII